MNQELQKRASQAAKTFGTWKQQMQRDGFTKRESLSADTADPAQMSVAALALWNDYKKAQKDLDAEARDASQKGLGFEEDEEQEADRRRARARDAPAALKVEEGGTPGRMKDTGPPAVLPDADAVKTPDGMDRAVVHPDVWAKLKDGSAVEGLSGAKPVAKPVQFHDREFVVLGVASNYLVLTPCLEAEKWMGNTYLDMTGRDIEDVCGLLFKVGKTKNAKAYVVGDYAASIAVIAGDPLKAIAV